ncbi:K(+) efflux antiporter 4-like isoform X4 [Phoenix dactylifera]|uniref:K(+) efflux antiporter 4-like isoform X4 n=1 Tax=Phoenix dactylifera TaxID=42345 RepID=A0A8B8J804_PHODC|nr:K(+) efflux antiporter 4-like isoform X4 [Phoenix dactylifera]
MRRRSRFPDRGRKAASRTSSIGLSRRSSRRASRAVEKSSNSTGVCPDTWTWETDAGSFNNTVAEKQAVLETVARVTPKKNETKEEKGTAVIKSSNSPFSILHFQDNVFIISNPKSKYPVLQLDLRLISDLVVIIVSATCGGIAFARAGQPVITGYLLAGSVIGPGGFSFISEMVQVETVAQFGVIFLLFALGLEFFAAKLHVVRAVAVLGGLLQIVLFMCLCGAAASLCGGKTSEGVFVGAFLSMSSTTVVFS